MKCLYEFFLKCFSQYVVRVFGIYFTLKVTSVDIALSLTAVEEVRNFRLRR